MHYKFALDCFIILPSAAGYIDLKINLRDWYIDTMIIMRMCLYLIDTMIIMLMFLYVFGINTMIIMRMCLYVINTMIIMCMCLCAIGVDTMILIIIVSDLY